MKTVALKHLSAVPIRNGLGLPEIMLILRTPVIFAQLILRIPGA